MRRMLIVLMCAGVAQPALAFADQDRERGGFRSHGRSDSDRSESRSERAPPESARPGRSESSEADRPPPPRVAPPPRADRPARVTIDPTEMPDARPVSRPLPPRLAQPSEATEPQRRADRRPPSFRTVESGASPRPQASPTDVADSVRDWRAAERRRADSPSSIEERNLRRAPPRSETAGGLVEPSRPLPRVLDPDRVLDPNRRERRISRTPAPGTEPPAPTFATEKRTDTAHRWRREWRHDRRYDWRDHRRRNRSHFHLALYLDPFGWDYYRYGIGWRLWPSYYNSRYWLNDPWSYRLPPAYGPYRWIRYHDDALLVNTYTGEVVDVIYDFFW